MKVFIWPTLPEIQETNGIGKVVHAQYKYLPQFGVELVSHPDQADVIACHTQQYGLPRVDVLHCHGIYWTGDPGSGRYSRMHHRANAEVMAAARRAKIITVPSNWVSKSFQRDMRLNPTVIGHGINPAEWVPGEPKGYVLWNKNRSGDVCDPSPAWKLASLGIPVTTTFAPPGAPPQERLRVIGSQPFAVMREVVRNASVYLATVKETYGIGTLEAMAAGVPVLGFNHGGTEDLVRHKENGYLVTPGDYDDLVQGYHYIVANRSRLSSSAREFALTQTWERVMEQYANVYQRVMETPKETGVAVIITSYNYASFVGQAIESVLHQTHRVAEIIVVDDGSTDETKDVLAHYKDSVTVIHQQNQGVAEARNNGIRASNQPFIICLDADDMLDPRYVETLQSAMVADRGLGVAYTGLSLMTPDGSLRPNAWPPAFNWDHMTNVSNPPSSCIHIAAMFRKDMWERAGGYRQVYAPGEDTEFWVRGLSLGFTARQVWDEGIFWYRAHGGSASRTKTYKRIDGFHPWMRDKQYPMAAPANEVPVIRSYSEPTVSVIIPVSDGHVHLVSDAIESLLGQEFRNWEVIVADDTVEEGLELMDSLALYPFSLTVRAKERGVGYARNLAIEKARAPLVLFLDADDYLYPSALKHMIEAYAQSEGRYVYTHWVAVDGAKQTPQEVPSYSPQAMLKAPQHGVTVLIDKETARKVGFRTDLEVLEDWEFFARCAVLGYHGVLLPEHLLFVRTNTGGRTSQTMRASQKWLLAIQERIDDFMKGQGKMGSCCGGNGAATMAAKGAFSGGMNMDGIQLGEPAPGVVRMQFIGEAQGAVSYGGPGITPSGSAYRGANNPFERYIDAQSEDVQWLVGTGKFAVVPKQVEFKEEVPVDVIQLTQAVETPPHQVTAKVTIPPTPEPVEVVSDGAVDSFDAPIADAETEAKALEVDGQTAEGRKRGPGRPRKS